MYPLFWHDPHITYYLILYNEEKHSLRSSNAWSHQQLISPKGWVKEASVLIRRVICIIRDYRSLNSIFQKTFAFEHTFIFAVLTFDSDSIIVHLTHWPVVKLIWFTFFQFNCTEAIIFKESLGKSVNLILMPETFA